MVESSDIQSSYHKYVVDTANSIVRDLTTKEHVHLQCYFINSELTHADLFAEYKKAEPIGFPKDVQPMRWIRNDVLGTSLVVDAKCFSDILYKFGPSTYMGSITTAVIEYGDPIRARIQFVIAKNEQSAAELIESYYEALRHMFGGDVILDHCGQVIKDFRRMSWDEIFLPDDLAQRIREDVKAFFSIKREYDKRNIEWRRGILLAGPPGNGKTCVARALSSDSPVQVVYCTLDDNKDSMDTLRELKGTISKNSPCLAIIEDADSMNGDDKSRGAFLNMMDGITSCNGVFFIASTNCPEKLDFAFTNRPSRFDSYYVIGNPKSEQRRQIIKAKLRGDYAKIPEAKMKVLIDKMDGLSAAAVQEVAVCSIIESIKSKKAIDIGMLSASLALMRGHMKASKDGSSKWTHGSLGF